MDAHGQSEGYRETNRATVRLVLWTLAWTATLAVAKFGPARWSDAEAASWVAIGANFGAGWVGGFSYLVADHAGLVAEDVNIAVFPTALGVVYAIAFVTGSIRYR